MFSASVWGEIWGPKISCLDVSGGSKRRTDGKTDFLIWEMPHELKFGDRVRFSFEEGSACAPRGKVFDDKAPALKAKIDMSFPPTDDDLTRLESRPAKNSSLKWLVSFMDAPAINISPDANRQHLGLGLLWNEDHPERLRVNLSKTSLREMVSRIDGEELFLEYVPLGSSFEVAIGI